MTSLRGDSSGREALGDPSREPLLWVQLLGLAAWPLEALGLLLLIAGGDPGPFPLVERLFCWGLGGLLPAVLFWRLPPDLWSLLLVQVPLRGRRERQLRLSTLQTSLGLKLVGAAGALPLLALVWWADRLGGIAWSLSPLATTPRLLVLLVCVPLLALMLWQWQQLVQSTWLLSRPSALLAATLPLSLVQAQEQRLNLGLPLLLLPDLSSPAVKPPAPAAQPTKRPAAPHLQESSARISAPASEDARPSGSPSPEPQPLPEEALEAEPGPTQEKESSKPSSFAAAIAAAETADAAPEPDVSAPLAPIAAPGGRASAVPLAVDDQQPPKKGQGNDLDQQI